MPFENHNIKYIYIDKENTNQIMKILSAGQNKNNMGKIKKHLKDKKKRSNAKTLWPGGSNWLPPVPPGRRVKGKYGCGKCRWRPTGCRGCKQQNHSNLKICKKMIDGNNDGKIIYSPESFKFCDFGQRGKNKDNRKFGQPYSLSEYVEIVNDARQSDENGYGVVARKQLLPTKAKMNIDDGDGSNTNLRRRRRLSNRSTVNNNNNSNNNFNNTLIDETGIYVTKPSVYAQAHLPEYAYISCGKNSYFQLKEEVLGHISFTYYLNEARGVNQTPNVKWKPIVTNNGEKRISWEILRTIETGEELLVKYKEEEEEEGF